jgi:hypothetical protein
MFKITSFQGCFDILLSDHEIAEFLSLMAVLHVISNDRL